MNTLAGISPVWISLGPVIAINVVLLTSYAVYRLWVRRRKERQFAGAKTGGSQFLGSVTREWWFWTTDPIVHLFVKLRLGPNALTAIGFLLAAVAAFLFAKGWFGYAGWAMIFGASFDMFDGRVARITGKTSRSGAFFDAVMDRFGEGACLLGLAYYFRTSFMLPIVIAALVGSLLVSYTKARAEGIGVECNVGWMQRPERIVYLGVASVLDPMMNLLLQRWWALPPPLLVILAIILIAVMTNATAIYRMVHVMNALDTADKRETESIPQLITKLSTHAGREELWSMARFGYDRSKALVSHVVLFLAGGISPEIMSELARRGDLPNISKHIIERGSSLNALSVFPSTAGPASTPFATGCFPGTCDIPGVRWFDRTVPSSRVLTMNRFRDYLGWGAYAMDHDLSKATRTIFEYSRQAVNIFGMPNRGCGLVRDPAFFRMHGRFQRASRDADVAVAEENAFNWFATAVKRETDFVLYSFPPSGLTAGASRASIEQACHSYRRLDDYVGRAADLLRKQGMYEDTALVFAGIHGIGEAAKSFEIEKFLSRRNKVCAGRPKFREWHDADVIALASGTSMAHIYVRNGGDWTTRSFFEDVERTGLVGSLLEQNGVDILAGRSVEGGIVVQSRRGRAHILEDADGRITCLVKGSDPFGIGQLPQVMSAASALKLTEGSSYPDGIVQILQLFRSGRTGDLVVSARSDTVLVFEADNSRAAATNGSLASEHIVVPFMSSIPCETAAIRTVDVFAKVMELLGIEPAHKMDGVILHSETHAKVNERARDMMAAEALL